VSEPKRYDIITTVSAGRFSQSDLVESKDGNLVSYEDYARLKEDYARLKADLNKMTKTPDGVDGVEVKVSFWTKSGSLLPSSYSTFFWVNDKGVQS